MVYLRPQKMNQKEEIVKKAHEIFLELGAKVVTMDEVSRHCGISKKTLYQLFENKEILLLEVINYIHVEIKKRIGEIQELGLNPIEELFEMHDSAYGMIKSKSDVFLFQMHKYYPNLYENCAQIMFNEFSNSIRKNINRGVSKGLYEESLDYNLIINLLFNSMQSAKTSKEIRDLGKSQKELGRFILDFYINSFTTQKGKVYKQKLSVENEI